MLCEDCQKHWKGGTLCPALMETIKEASNNGITSIIIMPQECDSFEKKAAVAPGCMVCGHAKEGMQPIGDKLVCRDCLEDTYQKFAAGESRRLSGGKAGGR
ncbi:MAG: hypothetical protein ACYDG6_06840 [Thermincolia bacterium]